MSAKAAVGASLLALGLAGCGSAATHPPAAVTKAAAAAAPQLRGLVPDPLPRRPNFTLTDTSGHPFDFATQTRGKLAYLYFGYTHCPDACPATMGDLEFALHSVTAAQRRQVEVVFVTVDPKRDTPKVLRAWLRHYDAAFVGLRGSERQVRAAESAAGIPLAPLERQSGTNYSVAHSSFVLPYSPDGVAHVLYTQGFVSTDYAHDLPLLLRFKGSSTATKR